MKSGSSGEKKTRSVPQRQCRKGQGGRSVPRRQIPGKERRHRVWKQEEANRQEDARPIQAGRLTEEDNSSNQGLDNNMAAPCWFSTVAQTNHYTSLPTPYCWSQVSTNPREETEEAS